MGTLIDISAHRGARRRPRRAQTRPALYFDLASPGTYLAAEQAERLFGRDMRWRPASVAALPGGDTSQSRAEIGARARALRLPLVWPESPARPVPAAMRIAALAVEEGRGAEFVLAACRLAFCGGFDLDDPEMLAEASAAAGLELDGALAAARDAGRDDAVERAGRRLLAAGADRLPVLVLRGRMYCGEERLAEAATAVRGLAAAR